MEENKPFIKDGSNHISRYSFSQKLCLLFIFLVLFLLLCLSALSLGLLLHFVRQEYGNGAATSPLSLEDLSNSSFSINYFSAQWSEEGDLLYSLSDHGLEQLDPSENSSSLLIARSEWNKLSVEKWSVSRSRSYLLLAHNLTKLYRHSYTADYSLRRLGSEETYSVLGRWRVVEWAGMESLVLANSTGLYFIKNISSSRVSDISSLRAASGDELVGFPDWVYEEEILSSNSAVWASPDSEPRIAFLTFNSTCVTEANIIRYGAEIGPYPSYQKIPYPKPGDRESSVQLHLVNTSDGSTCQIPLPPGYHYVQSVQWYDVGLGLRFLNEKQTNVSLRLYSSACAEISSLYNYETEGWVETNLLDSLFLSDGAILALLPMNQSGDSAMQIVRIEDNGLTQLTSSDEVRSLLAVQGSERVFYSSGPFSYLTNLYALTLSDPTNVSCVNCELSEKLAEFGLGERECSVASASFSQSGAYFILTCVGPDIPFSLLVDSSSLKILRVLEDNSALSHTLKSVSLPSIQPFQFSDQNYTFYGTRMIPAGFSESESRPVLLYVYGGPNSQLASLAHPLIPFSGYMAHLVSSLGFIVVTVEGRGTCCRGQAFRFLVKDRLGLLEMEDQLSLTRHLLSQTWVSSVSVMGASYGGYLSGMVLSGGSNLIAASIVMSPVTDWRYYDSVYTQRYMGTPQENLEGYNASSLILRAAGIDGRKLLLIHGSADDNVHYQNSAELSLALKRNGQQFRMHTYFNENHHLRQEGTREHLYQLLDSFLQEKVLS